MCLILTQIHCRIFNLAHRIRRKTNNLKTEEFFFETNMSLCSMTLEKIKTREGVAGHKKVITKRLLLKNLGETVFINNLLEYLYNAKIRSSEFDCFRAKTVKIFFIFTNLRWKKNIYIYIYIYLVLLLLFFALLVSISYYLRNFVSLLIKFSNM